LATNPSLERDGGAFAGALPNKDTYVVPPAAAAKGQGWHPGNLAPHHTAAGPQRSPLRMVQLQPDGQQQEFGKTRVVQAQAGSRLGSGYRAGEATFVMTNPASPVGTSLTHVAPSTSGAQDAWPAAASALPGGWHVDVCLRPVHVRNGWWRKPNYRPFRSRNLRCSLIPTTCTQARTLAFAGVSCCPSLYTH